MKTKQLKFEQALTQLEKIVEQLDQGKLPLEESLAQFAEGMELARICEAKLEEAQSKVETLVRSGGSKKKDDVPGDET